MAREIIHNAPKGFQTLIVEPCVLYYRVAADGGVIITSPAPVRCIFKEQISDGSIVEGGWTPNMGGTVFGDRIIISSSGDYLKKPLYWSDIDEIEELATPAPKRTAEPLPQMMPETKDLLEAYEREKEAKKRAAVAKNKWVERYAKTEGKKPRKREPVMSRPSIDPDKLIAGLKTENERLAREHATMKAEVKEMKAAMLRMKEENAEFKEQAESIRDDAIEEVRKIRDDYTRKSKINRWQIEAAPSRKMQIEGLEAKVWEIEDPDKEMRYLAVCSTPRGTERTVEEQWMADLKNMMERRFGDTLYYVIVPPDASLTVREVQPGLDRIDEEDDYGQF
jgi:hypothetical protein